jgi:Fe-S-cluster containining protein
MKLDVLSDEKDQGPWYRTGLSFTCTQCGNCCTGGPGYVWISDVEIDRLAEFLHLTPAKVIEQYCRKINDRYSLTERVNRGNYDCIFLREEPSQRVVEGQTIRTTQRVCSIYPVRPLQCRTWPFWDSTLASEQSWKQGTQRCPGVNHGKKYSFKQIESIRTAKDWPRLGPGSDR